MAPRLWHVGKMPINPFPYNGENTRKRGQWVKLNKRGTFLAYVVLLENNSYVIHTIVHGHSPKIKCSKGSKWTWWATRPDGFAGNTLKRACTKCKSTVLESFPESFIFVSLLKNFSDKMKGTANDD